MIEAVERAVLAAWSRYGLSGPRPARIEFSLDGRDARRHGLVRFTALRADDGAALFRGKIPRDGAARSAVLGEHDLLRDLADELPGAAGRLFPRALFTVEDGDAVATAEAIPPGTSPGPLEALGAAERWLTEFRQGTGVLRSAGAAVLEPYVRAALAAAEAAPAGPARERFEQFSVSLAAHEGVACTFGHGALRPERLLVDRDGTVCVEDWEDGDPRQPTWADPVHFALDLALRALHPEAWTEGDAVAAFRAAVSDDARWAPRVRSFLRATLHPGDDLALAIPACALAAAQRSARNGDGPPDPWCWRAVARESLAPDVQALLRAMHEPSHAEALAR